MLDRVAFKHETGRGDCDVRTNWLLEFSCFFLSKVPCRSLVVCNLWTDNVIDGRILWQKEVHFLI